MLTPDNVRVAIVLMKRAPIKGEEAANVANAIRAFEAIFTALTANKPPEVKETPESTEE